MQGKVRPPSGRMKTSRVCEIQCEFAKFLHRTVREQPGFDVSKHDADTITYHGTDNAQMIEGNHGREEDYDTETKLKLFKAHYKRLFSVAGLSMLELLSEWESVGTQALFLPALLFING